MPGLATPPTSQQQNMTQALRQRKGSRIAGEAEKPAGVEDLPRAKLQWTWISLLLSAFQIGFAFLLSKPFPFLVPQPRLPSNKNLQGTVTIVTGANSGIGAEIAKEQYLCGSHVILACRNQGRAEEAKAKIIREAAALSSLSLKDRKNVAEGASDRLEIAIVDCSSLNSVRSFCSKWSESERKIDFLFLNAGIASTGSVSSSYTKEGFHMVYVTNHLGPLLLTGLLSPFLTMNARVILTSSAAAFWGFFSRNVKVEAQKGEDVEDGFHYVSYLPRGSSFYGQSKAMQIVFANILQRRFDQNNHKSKIVASYHPGMVATNIFTSINLYNIVTAIAPTILNIIALTCKQGAQGALWLAQADSGFQPGGFYDRYNLIACPWYNYSTSNGIDEKMWKRWNADAGLQESDWHF